MDRRSSSTGSQGGTSGSGVENHQKISIILSMPDKQTYTLVLEALDNREGSWIMNILHHEPINCLLVLSIDAGGFDQLCLDSLNGLWLVIGVEMDCECVDHCGSLKRICEVGESD